MDLKKFLNFSQCIGEILGKERLPTTWGIIRYSENGAHIIPKNAPSIPKVLGATSAEQAIASYYQFEKAKLYLMPYKKQCFIESKARELIHSAGISTFPRPKRIPANFKIQISSRGAGIKYIHPDHPHTSIRVMPGKLHSPNSFQQKPYVIHRNNGKTLDKFGRVVLADAPEAHIPLEEFVYGDLELCH